MRARKEAEQEVERRAGLTSGQCSLEDARRELGQVHGCGDFYRLQCAIEHILDVLEAEKVLEKC